MRAARPRIEVLVDLAVLGCAPGYWPAVYSPTTRRQKATACGLRRYSMMCQRPEKRSRINRTASWPMPRRRQGRETKNSAIEKSDRTTARDYMAGAHHCKPDRLVVLDDRQQVGTGVGVPAAELVVLAVTELGQGREHAGAQWRQVIEVIAIGRLEPLPIAARAAHVANADGHATETRKPAQTGLRSARAFMPDPVGSVRRVGRRSSRSTPRQPAGSQEQPRQQAGSWSHRKRCSSRSSCNRRPERRPGQVLPGCCKRPARALRQQHQERA